MRLGKLFVIVIFCILLLGAGKDSHSVEASLDKTKVSTGEFFTYTISLEGVFQNPKLIPPEFEEFKVVSQSQSQNYSFSKLGTKLNMKLIYVLFALKPGEFELGPAIVKDKLGECKSNIISISVEGKPFKDKKKILPYLKKGLKI